MLHKNHKNHLLLVSVYIFISQNEYILLHAVSIFLLRIPRNLKGFVGSREKVSLTFLPVTFCPVNLKEMITWMQMFEKKVRKEISRLGGHRRYYTRNFRSFLCICRQVEDAERAALMGKITNWSKTLFSITREAASWKSTEITSSWDENIIVLLNLTDLGQHFLQWRN